MRPIALLVGALLLAACTSAGGLSAAGAQPAARAESSAPSAPAGRSLPSGIASAVEAARREGRVVIFGTTATPAEEEELEQAFRDFYGFGLDIAMESGLHPQKVGELVAAARSGVRSGIDLFWSSDLILNQLDQAGLLRDGAWLAPLDLPPDGLMLHGKAARVHDSYLVNVLYNTQKVRADEAPRRYHDLLQPRWQGAIVAPRTPSLLVYLAYVYGEDWAAEFAEGLVRQRIAFVPTFPDATSRVAAGEYLLGMGQIAEREARRGAPLADAPLDIAIVIPWGVGLMADAEHPAAALLLAYFLVSPEGQQALDRIWANSLSTSPGTSAWRVAQGKQVILPPLEWVEREDARLRRKYGDILGMR